MTEIAVADANRLSSFLRDRVFEKAMFKHRPEFSRAISFFDSVQREAAIAGCIGEIGVANGALFVPLALCCRDDEVAVAVDIFDNQHLHWNAEGGSSSLARFKKNIVDVIGTDDQVRYVNGDSFFLTPERILSASDGRGYRLFSIDGAHSAHHTTHDLALVGQVLNPGGVVLLDDVRNWGWPGVIEGFARYMLLRDYQRLVPFFLFRNKLLLTTPCHQQFYLDATVEFARKAGRPPKMPDGYRISEFFGFRVVGWN